MNDGTYISVMPIETYTSASDNNGGGFELSTGFTATYANFHDGNGGHLGADNVTTVVWRDTGYWGFTPNLVQLDEHPTGLKCRCSMYDLSAGTYHNFYATYVYEDDEHRLSYMPVGASGIASEATVDDAIVNWADGDDEIEIVFGGALATPQQAALLAKESHYILVESGEYDSSTAFPVYDNVTFKGVKSDGTEAISESDLPVWQGDETDAMINLEGGYSVKLHGINFDDFGPSLLTFDTTSDVSMITNCILNKTTASSGSVIAQTGDDPSCYIRINNCKLTNLYTIFANPGYGRGSFGMISNCRIENLDYLDRLDKKGVLGYFIGNLCIDCGVTGTYWIYNQDAAGALTNNTLIGVAGANLIRTGDTGDRIPIFENNLVAGWNIVMYNTDTSNFKTYIADNNARYNVTTWISGTPISGFNNKELTADPFVDSANDDYRLNPAGADFALLYNSTTGQILAGALGPELAAGGGYELTGINVGLRV